MTKIIKRVKDYNYRERLKEFGFPFSCGPGEQGSMPGRVIPKIKKMALDTSLLNTQNYKVRIEGKVEQSRE